MHIEVLEVLAGVSVRIRQAVIEILDEKEAIDIVFSQKIDC